jgi:hypothetical protein
VHDQVKARADADPRDTQRQHDLSVSHGKIGDVARAEATLPPRK